MNEQPPVDLEVRIHEVADGVWDELSDFLEGLLNAGRIEGFDIGIEGGGATIR